MTTYLADCETQLSQAPRRGLLYGVPVSLKECFSCKVCPTSCLALTPTPLLHPCPCQLALPPGLPGALQGLALARRMAVAVGPGPLKGP